MKPLVEAQLYRDAGAVKRYHVKRTLRQQTVAEHTFGMLMLVKQVIEDSESTEFDVGSVYDAILHHDLPELMTGDVPAPIKRAHPELGPLMDSIEQQMSPLWRDIALSPLETALIKWADRMELVLWCLEEYRMGNAYVKDTIRRGIGWILAGHMPDCCRPLTDAVVRELRDQHNIKPATGAELERNA